MKSKRKNASYLWVVGHFESKIRRAVKISSISFWLDVHLSILTNRLSKSKRRPLLFEKNLNETVKKIYLERKKIYNEASFRIKCGFEKKDEIVKKILRIYENSRN